VPRLLGQREQYVGHDQRSWSGDPSMVHRASPPFRQPLYVKRV
jgi:hypothetical protein